MNVRLSIALVLASLSSTVVSATLSAAPAKVGPGTSSQFQVGDKTQVPGHTLKTGTYSLVVVDQLSDRMVLRIVSDAGKEEATFLAVAASAKFPSHPTPGPVDMHGAKTGQTALRGFVFADGSRAEFVYPKAEAVSLAKSNQTSIVAVDPASEGRTDAPSLSKTDRELVTLWQLTPTVVDGAPSIAAQRYEVASLDKPAAPVAAKRVAHPPAVLPHTASTEPIVVLAGLASLFIAASLGVRRGMAIR